MIALIVAALLTVGIVVVSAYLSTPTNTDNAEPGDAAVDATLCN